MKIIFSPAKDLNLDLPVEHDWNISANTQKIVSILKALSAEQLQQSLKINASLTEKNLKYIEGFDMPVSYKAIEMYNGLAYRHLDIADFLQKERHYLAEHLILLSALYGPILPDTHIKPYRLDFHTPLEIDGQSLKAFWKASYNDYFEDNETIINLASDEFSSLLDKTRFDWIDISFFEKKNGTLKKHSTVSKKGRGAMLRFMAKKQIISLEALRLFATDGFAYDEKHSTEHDLVFVR